MGRFSFFGAAKKTASQVSEKTRREDIRRARQYDPSMPEKEARDYTQRLRARGQMLKKNPTAAERAAWDRKYSQDKERAAKAKKTRDKKFYDEWTSGSESERKYGSEARKRKLASMGYTEENMKWEIIKEFSQ